MYYGEIYIGNTEQQIQEALRYGFRVIAIDDDIEGRFSHTPVMIASNLLPPPDIMEMYMDNRDDLANQRYYNYLVSDSRVMAFAVIIAALRKGTKIFLYVPKDVTKSFNFWIVLISVFENKFGIGVGDIIGFTDSKGNRVFDSKSKFSANSLIEGIRLQVLYECSLITFEEAVRCYPPNLFPSGLLNADILRVIGIDGSMYDASSQAVLDYIKLVQNSMNRVNPLVPIVMRLDKGLSKI